MVHWDPKALTAISTEEVEYKEEQSKLYYLKYYLSENSENSEFSESSENIIHKDAKGYYAVVATTRPEAARSGTCISSRPDSSVPSMSSRTGWQKTCSKRWTCRT